MFGHVTYFVYYNGNMYSHVAIAGWKNHMHNYVDVYQGTFSGPGNVKLAPGSSK